MLDDRLVHGVGVLNVGVLGVDVLGIGVLGVGVLGVGVLVRVCNVEVLDLRRCDRGCSRVPLR